MVFNTTFNNISVILWKSVLLLEETRVPRKQFQRRRFFRTQAIRNKNCLWWPYLLTDRDKMSTLYRGPSIYAFYQVSVHLIMQFQRRRFLRNRPIRNKNCLWRPCLLMDRDKMCSLQRGPPIDASYQVSVCLAKRFQRRRILKISPSETRFACGGHVCQQIGTK